MIGTIVIAIFGIIAHKRRRNWFAWLLVGAVTLNLLTWLFFQVALAWARATWVPVPLDVATSLIHLTMFAGFMVSMAVGVVAITDRRPRSGEPTVSTSPE